MKRRGLDEMQPRGHNPGRRIILLMPFPVKVCVVCEEEFELKPDHPGYANRCPVCTAEGSAPAAGGDKGKGKMTAEERKSLAEANEARRQAMRNLLYRKDS